MMKKTNPRNGSALILALGLVVTMTALATAFLAALTPVRGAGDNVAFHGIAQLAAESAKARVLARLADSLSDPYTTTIQPWQRDFMPFKAGTSDPVFEGIPGWTDRADSDAMVNVPDDFRPTSVLSETSNSGGYQDPHMSRKSGFHDIDEDPAARWCFPPEVRYLDWNLRPADTDSARYVIRYAVEVSDEQGKLTVNPDIPGHPWERPGRQSAPNVLDSTINQYLMYQTYMERFTRSLRSMAGKGQSPKMVYENGRTGLDWDSYDIPRFSLTGDWRQRRYALEDGLSDFGPSKIASLFRGHALELYHGKRNEGRGSLQYEDKLDSHVAYAYSGPTRSYHQVWRLVNDTSAARYALFNPGLRTVGFGGSDSSNVPWVVNLITAPDETLQIMISGYSGMIDFSDRRNTSSFLATLGENYPEPFPLARTSGRNVPIVGWDGYNGEEEIDSGLFGLKGSPSAAYGTGNNYMWDLLHALMQTLDRARSTWREGVDHTSKDPNCKLTVDSAFPGPAGDFGASSLNPATMLQEVEGEFLRLVGEDDATPASGLLATALSGGTAEVGFDDTRFVSLDPASDTRAMEYALNDVRMSFFGSPALDFNGDGAAESTVAGWVSSRNTTTGSVDGRTWSWWFPGTGPNVFEAHQWLESPRWVRFNQAGEVLFQDSTTGTWNALVSDSQSAFVEVAGAFVDDSSLGTAPIRDWSATGRLFIGQSRIFRALIRVEIHHLIRNEAEAVLVRDLTVHIDPDGNGDVSDMRVLADFTHQDVRAAE